MPTALQVNDILSLRHWSVLDEQAAVNTFNVQVITVTGGAVTDRDLAQQWDSSNGVFTFYKAAMAAGVEYRGVQVYFLKRSGPLPNFESYTGNAGLATGTGVPVPRNSAAILKYNTTTRGPGGRGRIYLPFVASSFVAVNGRPTVAFETLANSLLSNLIIPLTVTAGGSTAVVTWELVRRPPGGPVTATGQIINALSADKFGQMHKRGDYGRANESPI